MEKKNRQTADAVTVETAGGEVKIEIRGEACANLRKIRDALNKCGRGRGPGGNGETLETVVWQVLNRLDLLRDDEGTEDIMRMIADDRGWGEEAQENLLIALS